MSLLSHFHFNWTLLGDSVEHILRQRQKKFPMKLIDKCKLILCKTKKKILNRNLIADVNEKKKCVH